MPSQGIGLVAALQAPPADPLKLFPSPDNNTRHLRGRQHTGGHFPGRAKRPLQLPQPEEIQDTILMFACAHTHADIERVALTCKSWAAFVRKDKVWKALVNRKWAVHWDSKRYDVVHLAPKPLGERQTWCEFYRERLAGQLSGMRYLHNQPYIDLLKRSILVGWSFEFIESMLTKEGRREVLSQPEHYQCVAILDRYWGKSKRQFKISELQRVGAACAVLAMNMQKKCMCDFDANVFSLAAYYTDDSYTSNEIRECTHDIFTTLRSPGSSIPEFESPLTSCDHLMNEMQRNVPTSSTCCFTHYLLELCLQTEVALRYRPLIISASAYVYACKTLQWLPERYLRALGPLGLSEDSLTECMGEIERVHAEAFRFAREQDHRSPLVHTVRKYLEDRCGVGALPPLGVEEEEEGLLRLGLS